MRTRAAAPRDATESPRPADRTGMTSAPFGAPCPAVLGGTGCTMDDGGGTAGAASGGSRDKSGGSSSEGTLGGFVPDAGADGFTVLDGFGPAGFSLDGFSPDGFTFDGPGGLCGCQQSNSWKCFQTHLSAPMPRCRI